MGVIKATKAIIIAKVEMGEVSLCRAPGTRPTIDSSFLFSHLQAPSLEEITRPGSGDLSLGGVRV